MVSDSPRTHLPYVALVALLWGAALPAVLVADAGGGIPWRGPLEVVGAVVLATAGIALVHTGSRALAAHGIGLFGVRPGEVLVTEAIYGRIRNPVDVGTLFIAFATWLALDLSLGWVIPGGALVSFVAGVGPYEDRLLHEAFGDDFRAYRRAVPKWRVRGNR